LGCAPAVIDKRSEPIQQVYYVCNKLFDKKEAPFAGLQSSSTGEDSCWVVIGLIDNAQPVKRDEKITPSYCLNKSSCLGCFRMPGRGGNGKGLDGTGQLWERVLEEFMQSPLLVDYMSILRARVA